MSSGETMNGNITRFKPNLEKYGQRQKISVRLSYLFILVCLITPATNWAIPFIRKAKLGSIYYVREK